MQTSQLQSLLCRNAAVITALTSELAGARRRMKESKDAIPHCLKLIRHHRPQIIKLAAIQKAIKFDLHAAKLARLRQNGHRRNKHGKADQRYTDWQLAQGQKAGITQQFVG